MRCGLSRVEYALLAMRSCIRNAALQFVKLHDSLPCQLNKFFDRAAGAEWIKQPGEIGSISRRALNAPSK